MFYDLYVELCKQKGVSPTRAAIDIGLSKSTPTTWKKGRFTPQGESLNKIAAYFDVSVDSLLSYDSTGSVKKEATVREDDGSSLGFDDFLTKYRQLSPAKQSLVQSLVRELSSSGEQADDPQS